MTPNAFIHQLTYDDLPEEVRVMGRRCLLDLIGVWAAGASTDAAKIINDYAADHHPAGKVSVPMLFDGRAVNPVAAAHAGGNALDSFDAHDGHEVTKGHAGVALLPALLSLKAAAEAQMDGKEFLTTLIVGYEIAIRAGLSLHATASDYHSSGAWNSVGSAAMGARLFKLDAATTDHALGIAEYHGPRAPMMRCIDYPTMLKDSSAQGARAGTEAAILAAQGFTGGPAETIGVGDYWDDLGQNWLSLKQNFKAYPVCRWAQPAVECALAIKRDNNIDVAQIDSIKIETFHEAKRLHQGKPANSEEAQYGIRFPVAVALAHDDIRIHNLTGQGLHDPAVLSLIDGMEIGESDEYNALFPQERYADMTITLKDGATQSIERISARGNYDNPLSNDEIEAKFHINMASQTAAEVAGKISESVWSMGENETSVDEIFALCQPV